MKAALVFVLLCFVVAVTSVVPEFCATSPFGVATAFNLFVLSSSQALDGCGGDVEGAIAGAGPINLLSYTVGLKIGASFPFDYSLVSFYFFIEN